MAPVADAAGHAQITEQIEYAVPAIHPGWSELDRAK